jgi:predicted nucleic acid-binding protein
MPIARSAVYVDTSIFVAAIVVGSEFHAAATAYCRALVEGGRTVIFAQLTRVELLQAIRSMATVPTNLSGTLRRRHRLGQWSNDVTVRQRWFQHGIEEFNRIVGQFTSILELPLHEALWHASAMLMAQYHLDSYDALHAATAIYYGASEFATLDSDFTRVAELNVALMRRLKPFSADPD